MDHCDFFVLLIYFYFPPAFSLRVASKTFFFFLFLSLCLHPCCQGPLDVLNASEKEHERSRRVALASGRKVFCTDCRIVVGIVSPEDARGGPVACPTCRSRYCGECGHREHGKAPCPPPKDMEAFMTKNNKNTKASSCAFFFPVHFFIFCNLLVELSTSNVIVSIPIFCEGRLTLKE